MTPQEFKAWFDGFTEAIDKAPTQKQWDKIKERVSEIDGRQTSYPIYVDRYVRPAYPHWYPYGISPMCNISGLGVVTTNSTQFASGSPARGVQPSANNSFDSLTAMNALGKADAQLLNP